MSRMLEVLSPRLWPAQPSVRLSHCNVIPRKFPTILTLRCSWLLHTWASGSSSRPHTSMPMAEYVEYIWVPTTTKKIVTILHTISTSLNVSWCSFILFIFSLWLSTDIHGLRRCTTTAGIQAYHMRCRLAERWIRCRNEEINRFTLKPPQGSSANFPRKIDVKCMCETSVKCMWMSMMSMMSMSVTQHYHYTAPPLGTLRGHHVSAPLETEKSSDLDWTATALGRQTYVRC